MLTIQSSIGILETNATKLLKKSTDLENRSRRNNIRIDGIHEDSPSESWDVTEQKVKEVLMEKLQLDFTPNVERAHRVFSRKSNYNKLKPKTVICNLSSWKEKDFIVRQARKLKPRGLFINEDFADETIKRRKELLPKLKAAREQGKMAYFVVDKLVIKNIPVSTRRPTGQADPTDELNDSFASADLQTDVLYST